MNPHILVIHLMSSVCVYNVEGSQDKEEAGLSKLLTGSVLKRQQEESKSVFSTSCMCGVCVGVATGGQCCANIGSIVAVPEA